MGSCGFGSVRSHVPMPSTLKDEVPLSKIPNLQTVWVPTAPMVNTENQFIVGEYILGPYS